MVDAATLPGAVAAGVAVAAACGMHVDEALVVNDRTRPQGQRSGRHPTCLSGHLSRRGLAFASGVA